MDLWKYCTEKHCRQMLLSFRLFGGNDWPDEKVMACIYALSNHAERHYSQVQIPKRSGGVRTLLVPDELLRNVQRSILHHILDGRKLAHGAAAYHRGASTVRSAASHTGKPLVLKMDIEDFFGSITFPMVLNSAFPRRYFPPQVGTLLTALCCCHDYLPQGAPTSPAISNLVMKPFDEYMERWCGERGITYSRYCDDLIFSGIFDAALVKRKVYGFLHAMGFEPNRNKTRILPSTGRQLVTGIVVNEKTQTPRNYRRELRKDIYYCEKFGAEEHLRKIGDRRYLPEGRIGVIRYLESLLGKINYVLMVNKEDRYFLDSRERMKQAIREMRECDGGGGRGRS